MDGERKHKIEAVLFDVDGVIVPEGQLYFQDRLTRDYGIHADRIAPFFLNQFHGCLVGKRDIREELTTHLRSWGWIGSVDDLLRYWHEAERETDGKLLSYIDDLRKRGLKCYIASHQEKYRAEYLLENVGLKWHFDGAFFSCYVGHMKNEPRFYEVVLDHVTCRPEQTMFWDDNMQNILTAQSLGLDARQYLSFEQFKREMDGAEGLPDAR